MKKPVQTPKQLKHQQARTRVQSDDSDSKSTRTAQPTSHAATMRDKCLEPKDLTLFCTTYVGMGLISLLTPCNNFETALDFARSALKLVVLDSHKTYCI